MAAAEGRRHRQGRADEKISNWHCCERQLHIEPQLQGTLANTMHHLLVREEIKGAWNVYEECSGDRTRTAKEGIVAIQFVYKLKGFILLSELKIKQLK